MSLSPHQIEAQQIAAALATASQMLSRNTAQLQVIDPTLVASVTALATQLDSAVAALGKYAWAPAPVPPVSAVAGGG